MKKKKVYIQIRRMNTYKKKIIILGDSMIDRYYSSTMKRISPEAPIPIHHVHSIKDLLGGAANVALNMTNLFQNEKEISVEFITLSGKDEESIKLANLLNEKKINYHLFPEVERKTIVKNRIYVNEQMTTRFDIESTSLILTENSKKIYDYVYQNRYHILFIVFSDYEKGMLSESLVRSIMKITKDLNILTFVDPKVNDIEKYQDSFLLKPNLVEAKSIAPSSEDIDDMLLIIYQQMNCKYLLVTCGSDGMILYHSNQKQIFTHSHLPSFIVKDVTGAGDAVFASLIYSFYKYNNLLKAVEISNYIGYLSVQSIVTFDCSIEDIQSFAKVNYIKQSLLDNHKIFYYENELSSRTIQFYIKKIKEEYQKIVFTNGCFDIIHPGHLQLLKYCKSQGDFLIVGLNSDSSIQQLKGPSRPFHNEEYRSLYLSLLQDVDMIIIFHQQTPEELLKVLRPHILVKGGDYSKENIIGKEYVDDIHIFPLIHDKNHQIYSTTSILQKLN